MKILAIDPATKTGVTFYNSDLSKLTTLLWDNRPLTKTKKRKGEPKYFRLKKLWDNLLKINGKIEIDVIVCEGAKGFMRGKSAVEASHKFRGVVELFCAIENIEYIEIEPNDLKQFALGKRSGEKWEMIKRANEFGYVGDEDNEADSFLVAKWYLSQFYGGDFKEN